MKELTDLLSKGGVTDDGGFVLDDSFPSLEEVLTATENTEREKPNGKTAD
jgi:hypothetical protein